MRFALMGASGYIAPRHMKAIKDTGNELVVITDPNDSVGIVDSYFPRALYIRNEGTFFRFVEDNDIDYLSICTPNHLHLNHISSAMCANTNVICEKPLVIHPERLDKLKVFQKHYRRDVNVIMQLRLHPEIIKLREKIHKYPGEHSASLNYVTPRGDWYFKSWKGDVSKSGGVLYNIGVHFFDVLHMLFGDWCDLSIRERSYNKVSGSIHFRNAFVHWKLSLDVNDTYNEKPYRQFVVDGKNIDLAKNFTNLHTESYRQILNGKGFTVSDIEKSIKMVHEINNLKENEDVSRPAL